MSTSTAPAVPAANLSLKIGTIISKGLESSSFSSSSSFFEDEEEQENEEGRLFSVNANLIATGRTCIIGSSGSGKSYTVGVVCEELCKSRVPFVIIDVEGEYSGLKEKYEAIWVGEDEKSDLRWKENNVDARLLAHYAPDCPPLIFDISEVDRPRERVGLFLLSLYKEISKRRTPYLVILEEADRFIPQSGERLQIFDEIARRGRKRGLGLLLCTQRPSLVDKNALSQCANQIIGKLVIKNDLQAVAQFFSGHGLPNQLTTLSAGEFYALGGLSPEPVCIKVRARETRHGGITPKLKPTTVRSSVESILAALESSSGEGGEEGEREEAAAEVASSESRTESTPVATAAPSLSPNSAIYQKEKKEEPGRMIEVEEGSRAGREKSTPSVLGLPPLIDQNDVPSLIKLEKSHRLFGKREMISRVDLRFHPLVEVGVRCRTGLIKKKFETTFFLFDGMTGRLLEPGDRLSFQYGLERLLGLEEDQILILRALHPDQDMSTVEVASAARMPEDQSRRLLKRLEERRLVRSSKIGRTKVHRRIIDLPKITLVKEPALELSELNAGAPEEEEEEEGREGKEPSASPSSSPILQRLEQVKIKESQVREIVKGMFEGADVESFRIFYYPVYHAQIIMDSHTRNVLIDGRTGKQL